MKVSGITNNGDWIFGRGKASYKSQSSAIRQNLITRLRAFTNDWFLDIQDGTDWTGIFGSTNNKSKVIESITNKILSTQGVKNIDSIKVTNKNSREVKVSVTYTDIFDLQFIINESVQA